MKECPYCGEALEPTQATCHNCKHNPFDTRKHTLLT
jgi:predicted nucleic acid-binding Zn ribbon protein